MSYKIPTELKYKDDMRQILQGLEMLIERDKRLYGLNSKRYVSDIDIYNRFKEDFNDMYVFTDYEKEV